MVEIIRKTDLPVGPSWVNGKYVYVRRHIVEDTEFIYSDEYIHPIGLGSYSTYYNCPPIYRDRLCFSYLFPSTLRHNYASDGAPWTLSSSENGRCLICRGLYYSNLYRCIFCDDIFIRDFYSPKFCMFLPNCYDCLPRLPWAFCPAHTRQGFPSSLKEIPPLGLNPKKYSKEELDSFDIFEDW